MCSCHSFPSVYFMSSCHSFPSQYTLCPLVILSLTVYFMSSCHSFPHSILYVLLSFLPLTVYFMCFCHSFPSVFLCALVIPSPRSILYVLLWSLPVRIYIILILSPMIYFVSSEPCTVPRATMSLASRVSSNRWSRTRRSWGQTRGSMPNVASCPSLRTWQNTWSCWETRYCRSVCSSLSIVKVSRL